MNRLAEYNQFEAVLSETEMTANFLPDVSTKEGYEKSKRIALDGRKVWNAIDKKRKALGAEARKEIDDINAEGKKHLSRVDKAINPHLKAYKDHDAEIKRQKEEAEAAITARINAFQVPFDAHAMTSEQVQGIIDIFMNDPMEGFGNRTIEAGKARESAVEALNQLKASKVIQEAEAERIEKERLELEKQQEEARKAQAIIDEANRIEAEKLAEAQAKIDAEEAERQAQEAQRIKDAEEAASQAERDRIAAEEAAAKAEAERKAANKNHRKGVNNAALKDLISVGFSEDEGKRFIKAVAKGEISHITINY